VEIERSEAAAAPAPHQVLVLPAELSEGRRKLGHNQRREAGWLMGKRLEPSPQRRNLNAEIVTSIRHKIPTAARSASQPLTLSNRVKPY
jgi:hypothetical protein